MTKNPALEVRGITKYFGDVPANAGIDFCLARGEIHALLGENGAGKSTLMNIICGLYLPNAGEIYVEGRKVQIQTPQDAIRLGIGMVHQHFMLIPNFSVAENIQLGAETTRGFFIDLRKAANDIRQLSEDYGLKIDPTAVVENLPVGLQQRVEIIKVLYRRAGILVLDEPTAVLTPQEADDLFRVMRQLTERGVAIIFITHKLKEVMKIADRISVMRRGRMIATTTPLQTDENELAHLMVGRAVSLQTDKTPAEPGDIVLGVENLTVHDKRKVEAVRDVSFQIRAGEVLGLAGVQGNGQTELAAALCGLLPISAGTIRISGKNIPGLNPRLLVECGVAHIPEDRLKHGLVQQYTIADNQVLNTYYQPPFANKLRRKAKEVFEHSKRLISRFDIAAAGPCVKTATLSGGNQQKVIVSRELSRAICLLVANQPTRGLDVGSRRYVHYQIIEMRNRGVALLLISSELDEIMSLSDRIAVMYAGKMAAFFDASQVSKRQLGLIMSGIRPSDSKTAQQGVL